MGQIITMQILGSDAGHYRHTQSDRMSRVPGSAPLGILFTIALLHCWRYARYLGWAIHHLIRQRLLSAAYVGRALNLSAWLVSRGYMPGCRGGR